ncbi:MAG: sugar ABC transporter substrate-binding protein [Bacillota bacterium]
MKKVMKKVLVVILALSLIVLAGCGANQQAPSDKKEEAKKDPKSMTTTEFVQEARALAEKATSGASAEIKGDPTIAVVMPALDHEGWLSFYTGIIMGVMKTDAGMISFSANNDPQKQMSIIEDLIAKKVKGILFIPVDSTALSAAVEKANQAGIPIVAMDRSTTGGKLSALVESDNRAFGREAAIQLAKIANGKELKIFNLQGDLASSAGLERNKGFLEEIKKYPNMKVVAEIAGNWQPEKGNAATLDAFQANPDINAIYLPSELYSQGVESALQQLGKLKPAGDPDHIYIAGIDGQPIALKQIKEGTADISISQSFFEIGIMAVEKLEQAIKGEEIKEKDVKMPPIIITKDNVDDENHWGNQFAK